MAHTGTVNGFYFDPDVFSEYMQEKPYVKDAIIASGIIVDDPTIKDLLGAKGNIGTMPIFNNIDGTDDALNFDGATANTPQDLTGKKQKFMKIGRMRAWKDKDFTRYLTGVSPLQNLADNLVGKYWTNQWQKVLLAELKGAMGVTALAGHKTNISVTEGSIADTNKVSETSLIELGAKALGDMAEQFALVLMHSAVYARYQALGLVNYDKYTIPGAITREITLSTIHGYIVVVDDSLVDTTVDSFPVYTTYLVGRGAFLGASCDIPNPYAVEYDPETDGGVNKLYTKQARVLHPNGLSIDDAKVAKESPTNTELAAATTWSLVFNHKNVAIAELKSNG